MPAYLIAEIDVTDPVAYEEYKKHTPAAIARYGGRFLVRGGTVDSREGDWSPQRLIVVEFPTMERARAFYESPEYAPALAIRRRAARSRLILAEGIG
jgi:uncharacterized protein (DUF1330 family)